MGDDIPDFMDIDLGEIPDELLDVNDEFIDIYLKNVRGELAVLWDIADPCACIPEYLQVLNSCGFAAPHADLLFNSCGTSPLSLIHPLGCGQVWQ